MIRTKSRPKPSGKATKPRGAYTFEAREDGARAERDHLRRQVQHCGCAEAS